MLRTNSKQARENVKKYIIDNFTPESYTETPPEEWHEIATFIYNCFVRQAWETIEQKRYFRGNEKEAFIYWASGLPSVIDTCYYYNRSAVQDLGDILEQTAAERERYTESDAERLLTTLIYNELIRAQKGLKEPKTIY